MLSEFRNRCEAMEECYEFMLAYAAQGLRTDEGSKSGGQVREFLQRAVNALTGLAEVCTMAVREERLERPEKYAAFLAVLDRDCSRFSCRDRVGSGATRHQFAVD